MPDYYQIPALLLTALLLPAFGHLYLRFRDTRSLLWFLGFLFAIVRMALFYRLGSWDFNDGSHPWALTAGQVAIQLSSALFLASLSPLRFRVGRFNVLYVIPFMLPVVVYTILFRGVLRGSAPTGAMYWLLPALGLLAVVAGLFWAVAKGSLPRWIGVLCCAAMGGAGLYLYFAWGAAVPLVFFESSNHFMTALLIVFLFRRLSPGTILSVLGFLGWSGSAVLFLPTISTQVSVDTNLTRAIVLAKVVAAMGMILLALEDQLALNRSAEGRERRARRELEAYTDLILSRRRIEDFDRQADEICSTVVEHSRFSQAALLFQAGGSYHIVGAAGLEPAIVSALDEMAARISAEEFLTPGSAPSAVEQSHTVELNLEPWLAPGDDLRRLRFTTVLAIPMQGRTWVEGALLLAGMRNAEGERADVRAGVGASEPLRQDDLLPLEMLAARLQASRSQTVMLEKLIDSEKFAGLGQLAGNVAQQLNNPLTVILGYASLLDETVALDHQEHKGVQAILTEARRMRSTLESLTRISRTQSDAQGAVSVAELLADMEELHRPDFLNRAIDFRINVSPSLPRVRCSAQPLRQAVLHCLQFAIDAVETLHPSAGADLYATSTEPKTIRLEATSEGNLVQILVAHSGPAFLHPDRAFDPYVPARASGETSGLGLSLCATILRDHNGRASAVNLEPRGAAIILELQAA